MFKSWNMEMSKQCKQQVGCALHEVQQRLDVDGGGPLDLHLEVALARRHVPGQGHLRAMP